MGGIKRNNQNLFQRAEELPDIEVKAGNLFQVQVFIVQGLYSF